MQKVLSILACGIVLLTTACLASAGPTEISLTTTAITQLNAGTLAQLEATQVAVSMRADNPPRSPAEAQPQRIILKNASLTITVENPGEKTDDIVLMAESMGGWVVTSSTSTLNNRVGEEVTSGSVTIRVPAERLNEALERIKSGTLSIDNETITGQDVTQEYVDISSRLDNFKAAEQQLQSIMDSADTVEDVLAVQQELTSVRGEIESLQGRINFFDEAAAFSSIRVEVRPEPPGPIEAQRVGWNPGTTAQNALGALVSLLQFLADTVIVLVIIGLPSLIIIAILLWLFRRVNRRFNFQLPTLNSRSQDDSAANDA